MVRVIYPRALLVQAGVVHRHKLEGGQRQGRGDGDPDPILATRGLLIPERGWDDVGGARERKRGAICYVYNADLQQSRVFISKTGVRCARRHHGNPPTMRQGSNAVGLDPESEDQISHDCSILVCEML